MVGVAFLLKFYHQIKRTRPEVFAFVEDAIAEQAAASGAKIQFERSFFLVSFNENSLAPALDLLLLVEKIQETMASVSKDIYGWTLAIFREMAREELPRLFRSFPLSAEICSPDKNEISSIWCHTSLHGDLEQFMQFGEPLRSVEGSHPLPAEGFSLLHSIKPIDKPDMRFSLHEKIVAVLRNNEKENCLIVAPSFSGKSESVEFWARQIFPPLIIRFGPETAGLACFSAALNKEIGELLGAHIPALEMENLLSLRGIIDRHFLHSQVFSYLFENTQMFFTALLSGYFKVAENLKKNPVIILENMHNTAAVTAITAKVFFTAFKTVSGKPVTILGTSRTRKIPAEWSGLFSRVFTIDFPHIPPSSAKIIPGLPSALWEIVYVLCLFKKYFPCNDLQIFFYEEGKSEIFLERALFMLEQYGIVRSKQDPVLLFPDLEEIAGRLLGERRRTIQNIIGNRLCERVSRKQLKVSFDLIVVLHELEKDIDNIMLLNAIINDVTSGVFDCIEKNIKTGEFERICGSDRAVSLRRIFETLKVLFSGNEENIKQVFTAVEKEGSHQETEIPLYLAEEYSIKALYRLGMNDKTASLEAVKKSVLLGRNDSNEESLSQVFRIMALVNLSSGQFSDAMDYIAFAAENAEKTGSHGELAINGYYAASIYYLFGNISKAKRFIDISKKSAVAAGQVDWKEKGDFFDARLAFETGNYAKALTLFEDLLDKIDKDSRKDACKTISAWIYRCKIYTGTASAGESPAHSLDLSLFEIEACYFKGDYKNAIKKVDMLIKNIPGPTFQFSERPDWLSGFTGIEFLLFEKRDFFVRFAMAYRNLSACRADKKNIEKAIQSMEHLMRNERFNMSDPNAPFFFYAYYRVLEEADAPEVDKNTAISMAFNRLQSRASKIDDLDTKRDFLKHSFWNQALFQTAKEHKLI
jgi:tetratricopeptide (TPR) repeat protein